MDGYLLEGERLSVFLPGEHVGVDGLDRVGDLFDPLDLAQGDGAPVRPLDDESEEPPASIDRLAWYVTERTGRDWGIFIREDGIRRVATALEPTAGRPSAEAHRQAATFLYLHEYGHFLVDVATLALEGVAGADLYLPHRWEILQRAPGWSLLEEALCNAFAYRRLSAPGKKRDLYRYLRSGPPGYDQFHRYRSGAAFGAGLDGLLGEVLRGPAGDPAPGLRGLFGDRRDAPVSPADVPVYLVRDFAASPVLALITALGDVERTKSFSKELERMPAQVRAEVLDRVLPDLERDARTHTFKRLKGDRDRFSARVRGSYRVILRQKPDGGWVAEGIDHRSRVYGR